MSDIAERLVSAGNDQLSGLALLQLTVEAANEIAAVREQNRALQQRLKRQRGELRRFNRHAAYFWHGWHRGVDTMKEMTLRGKMITAFGVDAVRSAEDGSAAMAKGAK